MSLVVNLIGQRSRDVIGRLSVSRDVIELLAVKTVKTRKSTGKIEKKKKKNPSMRRPTPHTVYLTFFPADFRAKERLLAVYNVTYFQCRLE